MRWLRSNAAELGCLAGLGCVFAGLWMILSTAWWLVAFGASAFAVSFLLVRTR